MEDNKKQFALDDYEHITSEIEGTFSNFFTPQVKFETRNDLIEYLKHNGMIYGSKEFDRVYGRYSKKLPKL